METYEVLSCALQGFSWLRSYQQDFFETSTHLIDDFAHIGYENNDAQGSRRPEKHEKLSDAIRWNVARQPTQEGQTDQEDADVDHATDIADEGFGCEEEAMSEDLQC